MKSEEEAAAKAAPPEKDLAKLQEEVGRRQTTIEIEDLPRTCRGCTLTWRT